MFKSYYTLAHLLLLTTGVAVFCAVLLNENKWLRAAYVTAALGIGLNAVIAAIFARGERQAFSLGFVVGALFAGLSANVATFTLPYLLSKELHDLIAKSVATPPSDEHFAVVVSVFWALLTATCAGLLSRWWYRSVQAGRGR